MSVMERNDYSNCPLKKRPIYVIKEEVEHENDDAPVDLSSAKRRHRTEWGSGGAIDFTKSKLPSIKEEEYNQNCKIYNENHDNWYGKELRINSNSYEKVPYYEERTNRINSISSVEHREDSVSPIFMSNKIKNHNIFKNPVEQREDSVSPPVFMSNRIDNRNLFKNPYRNFNNNVISRDLHYQDHQNNPQGSDHLMLSPSSSHISYSSNPSEVGEYSEPEDLSVRSKKKVLVPSDSSVNIQKHRKDFSEPESHDLYYQCRTCNKCYSTYAGLVKHQQCHEIPNEVQPNETEYKTISLSGSEYVKAKNNLENNNSRLVNHPRYQCKDCGKSYSTYSGLTKHQQFHCPSAEGNQVKKLFSCKNCDKVYVSLGALKMHIRTHTLPCKCPLCGKAFSRPWLLQGHIRTHTGEKPFSCQHCHRAFADRSNLRAHLQTHSDVKKYSCTSCTKTFSRMSLLGKHLQGGCSGVPSSPHRAYGSEFPGQTYYEEGKQIGDSGPDNDHIAFDGNPGTRHEYSIDPLYKEDLRVF